jgi:hypothetical protein
VGIDSLATVPAGSACRPGAADAAFATGTANGKVVSTIGAADTGGSAIASRRARAARTAATPGTACRGGGAGGADNRFATGAARAAGLACDRSGLAWPAGATAGITGSAQNVVARIPTARGSDGSRCRVDTVSAGYALPTLSARAAVADQPGVAAITTSARCGGGRRIRTRAATATVADEARVATVAARAAVHVRDTGTTATAVAEQQAAAATVLTCRAVVSVADQQAGIGMLGGAVADEDCDQCAERIRR